MSVLPLPPLFGENDDIKLAEEQEMINQISAKLSARATIALLALTGGCVPSAATDYRDNYGNNAYYGNFYGSNSGNGNGNYNANNNDSATGGSSQHHHHKHPITGNECSNDAAAEQNCGGNP